jgi:hypothetical protein
MDVGVENPNIATLNQVNNGHEGVTPRVTKDSHSI